MATSKSEPTTSTAEASVVEVVVAAIPTPPIAVRTLVNAGESTNPEVHRLIAELNAARSSADVAAIHRYTHQLEALGYRA